MNIQTHQSVGGEEFKPGQIVVKALTDPLPPQSSTDGMKSNSNIPLTDPKELEIRLKFAEETHQYVRDYIRQADQKATFLFAGSSGLLAYLNALNITNLWMSNPKTWGIIEVLCFIATASLIAGCICCAGTVVPRLKGSKKGIVFFEAIKEYENSAEYACDLLTKKPSQLCEAKYKHIYDLSSICRDKYKSLVWGFRFGMVGAFSTFALLIIK